MKIVILEAMTLSRENDIDFSVFEQYGEVEVYDKTTPQQVAERVREADAVFCNKSPMTRETLCNALNLKYIGLFATGYNNIDLDYIRANNITVCNAGSYSTEAVAQHVFAFILHFYNTITKYDNFVKKGGWINAETFSPFMNMKELYNKTIGIIGYGSIGKKVASIACAFGMKVMAYSRSHTVQKSDFELLNPGDIQFSDIDTILKYSDIVTVHCPLNKDSEKMCNKEFFSKMKSDSMFINTSRGGVVDEEALLYALNNGIIGCAALDVIDKEPMTSDFKLLKAENIVITPHAAWAPRETRARLVEIVSENFKKWLAGTPINVIE